MSFAIPTSIEQLLSYRMSVIEYVVFDHDVAHYQILSGGNAIIAEGYNVKAGTHVPVWPKYGGFPNELLMYHNSEMFCKPSDATVTKIEVTVLGKWLIDGFGEFRLPCINVASDPITIVRIYQGMIASHTCERSYETMKRWYNTMKVRESRTTHGSELYHCHIPESFKRIVYASEDVCPV